ncbi:MAG: excinuclease ABC subunit UvrA [Candidatus Sericytochromatia bacterium]
MKNEQIIIKGAKQHNLKNIDLSIPKNNLVVFTGVSGSGKSSLAFDTIFAEGQRRYVESLSSYARQFLGQMDKPDVEYIEGLSPAISIDQKSTSHNPRSTVGTVTEIYDYLRLLFARIGIPHCSGCGREINPQTIDQIVDTVLENKTGTKFQVLAPVVRGRKGEYRQLLENIKKEGFVRVRVDGKVHDIEEEIILEKQKKHDIAIVIDRLVIKDGIRSRLTDSIDLAMKKAEGLVLIEILEDGKSKDTTFSESYSCPDCNISIEEVSPRSFSFNSPYGACSSCHGLGFKSEIDIDKIIPDSEKSINDGAIAPWSKSGSPAPFINQLLKGVSEAYKLKLDIPFKDLPEKHKDIILNGAGDERFKVKGDTYNFMARYEGVIPNLHRRYSETESDASRTDLEKFMTQQPCEGCHGKRLKAEILAVTVNDKSISDVVDMSIDQFYSWANNLKLNEKQAMIAYQVMREIKARSEFLLNVGLSYLTLSRTANTLSGGEAQRIRLATQIGSGLTGVLYILDEPSIGLHQRDNTKLLTTLKRLRDLGNTLVVVEHDEETIFEADHIVDIGPKAGRHGGEIVAQGSLKDIQKNTKSLTGDYLSGRKKIDVPKERREGNGKFIQIKNASLNNLKNVSVDIPLGKFVSITGVSGSGKSSLISDILYPYLRHKVYKTTSKPYGVKSIEGLENLDKVISIDQSPIGRTPRSNPATYTGIFDPIRETFANTQESKVRGYKSGRFSFNVKGGRCENCSGEGIIKIEMNFLPDVYIPCEVCSGKRYNRETLEVKYKDKTISDVLDMTVEEGLEYFKNIPKIANKLQTLYDVGLDYIKLGQPATTLSGGEAQRVKLASELNKRSTGKTIYLLDEPTTGLHFADTDKLLEVLNRLVDNGNTVLVIEHNLDVIKVSDHIIDLGPEGGSMGGEIIAQGTPENIAKNDKSYTGQYLKPLLNKKKSKELSLI